MTTSVRRRRVATLLALVAGAVGLLLSGVMVAVGASALANSRAGRDASSSTVAAATFPSTPTALVAVVDDGGRLTSVAAMVLDPSGVGGSIVPIPATADSSLDLGDDRFPLTETYAIAGPESFVAEAEAMTAISFDVVEVMDAERLAAVVARLGPLDVDLPVDVIDDDRDEFVAEAGRLTLSPAEAAEVLTAFTSFDLDHHLEPARAAVWGAIAARVGAGIGSAAPVGEGDEVPTPRTPDEFLDRLFAGRVAARSLVFEPPPPTRNPRSVDTVVLDRAEVILVFAQIAPGRMAAPNESLSFRLEVHFSDDELEPLGVVNADIARDVINLMLFGQANVVSVDTRTGMAPEVSSASVADPLLRRGVEEGWQVLLGEIEVSVAEVPIAGVDATIVLGRSYLDQWARTRAEREQQDADADADDGGVGTAGDVDGGEADDGGGGS